MAGAFDELRVLEAGITQVADHAEAARAAIDDRVQPMLRAIAEEESENRRRLFALRSSDAYEAAYSDPEPLITVALPTAGRKELLLERALPSLLAQTYPNLEVRIIGDAVDAGVGESVVALGDPRVRFANLSQRFVHPDPLVQGLVGATMARNEAARQARGSWLIHFDDDDHLRPDAVAWLLALARERRAEVAYGGFEQHEPDGGVTRAIHFPPRHGSFSWAGALVHGGLRFFERELVAAELGRPGDMYVLDRMLRVGVRFGMLDDVVLDYFPSRLWESVES